VSVIHGFRPTGIICPHCGAAYGTTATTGEEGVYRYQCWCGSTVKFTLGEDEMFDVNGEIVKRKD